MYSLQHVMGHVISFLLKPVSVFLVTAIRLFSWDLAGPRELLCTQEPFDCPLCLVKKVELPCMFICFFCALFGQMEKNELVIKINSSYLSFRFMVFVI